MSELSSHFLRLVRSHVIAAGIPFKYAQLVVRRVYDEKSMKFDLEVYHDAKPVAYFKTTLGSLYPEIKWFPDFEAASVVDEDPPADSPPNPKHDSPPDSSGATQLRNELMNVILRYGLESDLSVYTALGAIVVIQRDLIDRLEETNRAKDDFHP